MPLKPKAPISYMSPEKLKVTIQSYQIGNKILKSELQNLQHEIPESSVKLDDGPSVDLIKIISNAGNQRCPLSWIFSWRNNKNT